MVTASVQPSIGELNSFIDKIRTYPVSAGQLQGIAQRKGAPRRVINFYRTFAPDRFFDDREDLAASSEQVGILRQEEPKMPKEEEKAPEDY